MVYKFVSGKVAIARVITDLAPDYTDWQVKAPLWILDALEYIGCIHTNLKQTPIEGEVVNHRLQLPCDIKVLKAIEYNGERVERRQIINQSTDDTVTHAAAFYDVIGNGWIWFSKPEGTLTIYYETPPLTFDKELQALIPLIPDEVKTITAIQWFILMKMLQTGYKHPVFDLNSRSEFTNPRVLWERECKAARNRLGSFDADGRNSISQMMRNFITDPNSHYTQMHNFDYIPATSTSQDMPGSIPSDFTNPLESM